MEEGPYFTFNKSWEHIFQPVDLEKKHVIVRGKHGDETPYRLYA